MILGRGHGKNRFSIRKGNIRSLFAYKALLDHNLISGFPKHLFHHDLIYSLNRFIDRFADDDPFACCKAICFYNNGSTYLPDIGDSLCGSKYFIRGGEMVLSSSLGKALPFEPMPLLGPDMVSLIEKITNRL
jgi:hypothetical protein